MLGEDWSVEIAALGCSGKKHIKVGKEMNIRKSINIVEYIYNSMKGGVI